MSSPLELYDQYAPRLYALALRLTGDRDAAAAVLEEVFVAFSGSETTSVGAFASLVRLTRERSLAREARSAVSPVDGKEPAPRTLVEGVWLGGKTVAGLAAEHRMTEDQVRRMLQDGMAEMRRQLRAVSPQAEI